MSDGIILLDKKPGITSMASDNFIKKQLGTKKVGHSGTLDPFATGLLPIFAGKALKVMRYTDDYDKGYSCTCFLGKTTETLDTEGEVIGGRLPTEEELISLRSTGYKAVRDAFEQVAKTTSQIPPKYSAKKIDGKKAYELARDGVEVKMKPHAIKIYSLDITDIHEGDGGIYVSFDVFCSKGTYIRTICGDIGDITGFGAHAVSLRRIKCGPFSIEDAVTEEEIARKKEEDDMSFILPYERALSAMPRVDVTSREYEDIRVGKKIRAKEGTKEDIRYAAYYDGRLVAVIYKATENGRELMRIERMLATDDRKDG